jgi:hypothetical protein
MRVGTPRLGIVMALCALPGGGPTQLEPATTSGPECSRQHRSRPRPEPATTGTQNGVMGSAGVSGSPAYRRSREALLSGESHSGQDVRHFGPADWDAGMPFGVTLPGRPPGPLGAASAVASACASRF